MGRKLRLSTHRKNEERKKYGVTELPILHHYFTTEYVCKNYNYLFCVKFNMHVYKKYYDEVIFQFHSAVFVLVP